MAKGKNSPEENASTKAVGKPKNGPAKKSAAENSAKAMAAAAETAAPSSQPSHPQASLADLHEEIRLRAYQIYCERGGAHGLHDADWHRAELEVRAKYGK